MVICRQSVRLLCAARLQRTAWAPLILALSVVLMPRAAGAQTSSAPPPLNARFAAVEATDSLPEASPTPAATAQKENQDDKATSEAPQPHPLDARAQYRALIEKEAGQAGLAPEIAEAVMAVESGYNPAAIGGVGEIGLMQLLPSTARMLGFSGTSADLAVPETNIHYGVTYLARAWRLSGGDLCTAVMKYRAGHGETRFSVLSVNYCLAVRSKLVARGFRVTGNVPVATFGQPGLSGRSCSSKCLGGARLGTVNIAALNSQLSALVVQTRAGR